MATDATGTPTSPDSIPKYNTAADAPSGLGFNAAMDALQVALSARATKPAGIVSGEAMIWNGAAFVRSSVTGLTPSGIAAYPSDGTKALFGDGTWKVPATADVASTHLGIPSSTANSVLVASQAYLVPILAIDGVTAFTFTRILFNIVTQSGNYDVGVYRSDDESTFTRVFAKGSTAVPVAGDVLLTVAQQTMAPVANRRWYFAFSFDNGTASIRVAAPSAALQGLGYIKAASFPLPASLTAMTAGSVVVPSHILAV